MYQQNIEQRNKSNLILVSFYLSRSSLKPLPKRSQSARSENLKFRVNLLSVGNEKIQN